MIVRNTIPYCPFQCVQTDSNHFGFLPCMLIDCMAFQIDAGEVKKYSGMTYYKGRCLKLQSSEDGWGLYNSELLE